MKKKKKAVQMKPLQKLIFISVSLRHFYETLLSTRIDKVQIFLNMMIIASLASAIAAAQVVLDGSTQQSPLIQNNTTSNKMTSAPIPLISSKNGHTQDTYILTVNGRPAYSIPASTILTPHPAAVSFVSQTGPDAAMAKVAGGIPTYSLLWNAVPPQFTPVATGLLPGRVGVWINSEQNSGKQQINYQNIELPSGTVAQNSGNGPGS